MKVLKESLVNGKSVIAFMPIKPEYAERIVAGDKHYEFRRTKIRTDLTHLVIYSSSPVKRIVGFAEVQSVEVATPSKLWEMTKHAAGISRQGFRNYFQGAQSAVAISLGRVYPLDFELCPDDVAEGFTIPQSFRYVDPWFFSRVITLGLRHDGTT